MTSVPLPPPPPPPPAPPMQLNGKMDLTNSKINSQFLINNERGFSDAKTMKIIADKNAENIDGSLNDNPVKNLLQDELCQTLERRKNKNQQKPQFVTPKNTTINAINNQLRELQNVENGVQPPTKKPNDEEKPKLLISHGKKNFTISTMKKERPINSWSVNGSEARNGNGERKENGTDVKSYENIKEIKQNKHIDTLDNGVKNTEYNLLTDEMKASNSEILSTSSKPPTPKLPQKYTDNGSLHHTNNSEAGVENGNINGNKTNKMTEVLNNQNQNKIGLTNFQFNSWKKDDSKFTESIAITSKPPTQQSFRKEKETFTIKDKSTVTKTLQETQNISILQKPATPIESRKFKSETFAKSTNESYSIKQSETIKTTSTSTISSQNESFENSDFIRTLKRLKSVDIMKESKTTAESTKQQQSPPLNDIQLKIQTLRKNDAHIRVKSQSPEPLQLYGQSFSQSSSPTPSTQSSDSEVFRSSPQPPRRAQLFKQQKCLLSPKSTNLPTSPPHYINHGTPNFTPPNNVVSFSKELTTAPNRYPEKVLVTRVANQIIRTKSSENIIDDLNDEDDHHNKHNEQNIYFSDVKFVINANGEVIHNIKQ